MINNFVFRQSVAPERTPEGVYLLSSYSPATTHERIYLQVRIKENRVLSDELVEKLPDLPVDFPLHHEWQLRKQTSERFCRVLGRLQKPLQILDLGCGNGWFSAKMAAIPQVNVLGLDLNLPELQQAQKLFGRENVLFCYGNIMAELFRPECFDIVVLNASIQYFQLISPLLTVLFNILTPTGEIHILDSPFYEIHDAKNAKQRTLDYYQQIGYPEMARYYFHHTFDELTPYSPIYKNRNEPFWQKILSRNRNPFPWVVIRKAPT